MHEILYIVHILHVMALFCCNADIYSYRLTDCICIFTSLLSYLLSFLVGTFPL